MGRGSKGTPPSLVSNALGDGFADSLAVVRGDRRELQINYCWILVRTKKPNADEIRRGRTGSTTRGDDRSAEAGDTRSGGMDDLFQFMAEYREAKRDSGMDEGRAGVNQVDRLEGTATASGNDALQAGRSGDAGEIISDVGDGGNDGRGIGRGDAFDGEGESGGDGTPLQSGRVAKERLQVGYDLTQETGFSAPTDRAG